MGKECQLEREFMYGNDLIQHISKLTLNKKKPRCVAKPLSGSTMKCIGTVWLKKKIWFGTYFPQRAQTFVESFWFGKTNTTMKYIMWQNV